MIGSVYHVCVFMFLGTKVFEIERGVQKLDLTGQRRVQLRAGSEVNLVSVGTKPAKQNSFRRSLAFCTERAQVTTSDSYFPYKKSTAPVPWYNDSYTMVLLILYQGTEWLSYSFIMVFGTLRHFKNTMVVPHLQKSTKQDHCLPCFFLFGHLL